MDILSSLFFSLAFLTNAFLTIWFLVAIAKGIIQLFTKSNEHLNGSNFINILEALTTLRSPFFGFAMLGNGTNQGKDYLDAPYLFIKKMAQIIIALYTLCVIGYWIIKLNPKLLGRQNYLQIFIILVCTLLLITITVALNLMTNRYDWEIMFIPVSGFPIMAIFINLFAYTHRLLWSNTIYKSFETE